MEYWMIGVLETIVPDTLHPCSTQTVFVQPFGFQNPSLNSRPLLQDSITPTTPGSEGTLLASFQGAPNKATSSGRGFFMNGGGFFVPVPYLGWG
jgi:hypothetical protein